MLRYALKIKQKPKRTGKVRAKFMQFFSFKLYYLDLFFLQRMYIRTRYTYYIFFSEVHYNFSLVLTEIKRPLKRFDYAEKSNGRKKTKSVFVEKFYLQNLIPLCYITCSYIGTLYRLTLRPKFLSVSLQ